MRVRILSLHCYYTQSLKQCLSNNECSINIWLNKGREEGKKGSIKGEKMERGIESSETII